ncbi:MAG: sigma-70 family RNA polymerase sigma factor, partial [Patescibacteria group bacterium]
FVKENEIDNVSAVLYKIARNLIIDDSRKTKEDLVGDEKMELIKDSNELNLDDKYINNERLFMALSYLTDDYRDIIVMYYINEMSLKDVANVLNKTEGATKTMLSRAIKQIREKLK